MKKIFTLFALSIFFVGGARIADAATLSATGTTETGENSLATTLTITATAEEGEILGALEVDHNKSSVLPEFHIYAIEGDGAYGDADDKEQFNNAGVTVTYSNGIWTLVFTDSEGEGPSAFDLIQDAEFYFALTDNNDAYLLGSMYDGSHTCASLVLNEGEGTMEEKTSDECPGYSNDEENQEIIDYSIAVSPTRGDIELEKNNNFILTVTPSSSVDLYELEVDHSLENEVPEFSLYVPGIEGANFQDVCGDESDCEQFETSGVNTSWDGDKWTIDFGNTLTQIFLEKGITFYLVLKNIEGESLFGSMTPTTPENTFSYTLTEKKKSPSKGSSGGGGSRSGTTHVTQNPIIPVVTDSLLIDGVNYDLNSLSSEEETIVKRYFMEQIISLLQQIIAIQIAQ
ncbi:MAG: hypothetical protein PHC89_02595 [Candidatus Pacebacteria bacterium]|nr:hypothetical protein [Candidatus Paceibacterota bacterium]